MRNRTLALTALLTAVSGASAGSMNWRWEDRFSNSEAAKLQRWVRHAQSGVESLFGSVPMTIDVHFHRSNRGGEPVPWANTSKGRRLGVNFHVDTRYSEDRFKRDWTAPHELSHLLFPYVGRSGMWFSEGIASYLQYQVMYANGTHSWERAIERYAGRFRAARRDNRPRSESIVDLTGKIRQTRSYVRLYWGGAAFFMNADYRLHQDHNMRLNDVIARYVDCCYRRNGVGAMDMIRTFDRISGTDVFSTTYDDTVATAGFPSTSQALAWLADNPPILRHRSAEAP